MIPDRAGGDLAFDGEHTRRPDADQPAQEIDVVARNTGVPGGAQHFGDFHERVGPVVGRAIVEPDRLEQLVVRVAPVSTCTTSSIRRRACRRPPISMR